MLNWICIIEVNDCVVFEFDLIQVVIMQLFVFYEWGVEKGCYVFVVIIFEFKLDDFFYIYVIFIDLYNGVCVFFDCDIVEQWLFI